MWYNEPAVNVKQFPRLGTFLAGLLLALGAAAAGAQDLVPVTEDLARTGAESRQRGLPILLVFSAEDCEYCQRLEEELLVPMLRQGLGRRAVVRKVMLDSYGPLRDFSGARSSADREALLRDVDVTPTLLFTDAAGRELAPRIVGYQSTEMYGAYVEAALAEAARRLRR